MDKIVFKRCNFREMPKNIDEVKQDLVDRSRKLRYRYKIDLTIEDEIEQQNEIVPVTNCE